MKRIVANIKIIGNALIEIAEVLDSVAGQTNAELTTKVEEKIVEQVEAKEKKKREEKSSRLVFTVADKTKKNAAETKLFLQQWSALDTDAQNKYITGQIDSLGTCLIEETKVEEEIELDLEEPKKITATEIRAAATALSEKHGKAVVFNILVNYNAKKIADLKEEQFDAILKEITSCT